MNATKKCSIENCNKPSRSRKLCSMHYARLLRTGVVGEPEMQRRISWDGEKCSLDNCDEKVFSRGFCHAHYKRWYRHGDPEKGLARRFKTIEENFQSRTKEQPNGCLEWIGYKSHGYGVIQIGDTHWRVHRYAWTQKNGRIPEGLEIDHICHNPACYNVEHLRVTTRKQNQENHQGPTSRSTSHVRGVWWDKKVSKWCVQVTHENVVHWGGSYECIEEAERAAIDLRNRFHTHNNLDRIA